MLAVLTAQLASGLVLTLLMLTQKNLGGWSSGLTLAALLAMAAWCQCEAAKQRKAIHWPLFRR